MTREELEARIKRLEDIEAIKRLKARYCFLCDAGYDAEALAELFTEDAVWDGAMLGKAKGRDGIRDFFRESPGVIPFAVHMVMNPFIEVEGDLASGIWYLFQACSYAPENQALWGSARYDERYVRVHGQWKIESLSLTSFFWTPFEHGWLRTRSVFERDSREQDPLQGRGEEQEE